MDIIYEAYDCYSFTIEISKEEGNELVSCHIPAYDLFFSAKDDKETIRKRAKAMVTTWFKFYNIN